MEEREQNVLSRVLLIAREDQVLFPEMLMPFEVTSDSDMNHIRKAVQRQERILLVLRREAEGDPGDASSYYRIGTMAEIRQIANLPNGQNRVLAFGTERVRILRVYHEESVYADVELLPMKEITLSGREHEALLRTLQELVQEFCEIHGKLPREMAKELKAIRDLALLRKQSIHLLPMPTNLRQGLLETDTDLAQYRALCSILSNEIAVLKIRAEIKTKLQKTLDKNQRDYVLREQMKIIREELGEGGPSDDSVRFFEETEALEASEEIKEVIRKEIKRYLSMNSNNSEAMVVRTYIETLLSLPWNKSTQDNIDMTEAKRILERDHYGLDDVKNRILEYLAVRKHAENTETPILCLVGPPGTGKTSIAKSIAEAMNRRYVRVCLGGVRDEAEIRGHRRTYIASMPGRIVQGLKQAQSANPLMLLDEVDKLGGDYKGDPSAALLEVLDSAQNTRFVDHYVEQPVDLSKVIFLATANSMDTIPKPLLDRMEILELSSYTQNEKLHIAKGHLIPKQRKLHGLAAKDIAFTDAAIQDIIEFYTKEAGVRELERMIGKVCRKVVLGIAEADASKPQKKVSIGLKNLREYLGRPRHRREKRANDAEVGVVRGLAWTAVGGTTLEIEVNALPGSGKLELTGRMGDVMKESAKTGISYIRSVAEQYNIPEDYFETHDIHIHIPEGAVPKDGPSAGITMATAVLSAVTNLPAASDVAMTGEVTLRGRVLPIGGLKEKLLAAKNIGINKVLLPIDNAEDLADIAQEITEGMELCPVSTMEEVLGQTLVR